MFDLGTAKHQREVTKAMTTKHEVVQGVVHGMEK